MAKYQGYKQYNVKSLKISSRKKFLFSLSIVVIILLILGIGGGYIYGGSQNGDFSLPFLTVNNDKREASSNSTDTLDNAKEVDPLKDEDTTDNITKEETNEDNITRKDDETNKVEEKEQNKEQNKELLKVDNKVCFKDSVFLGDSITEGLSFYEVVNEDNVVGTIGLSVLKSKEHMDEIVEKKPNNVYILLGTNDLTWDISIDLFINAYTKLITGLKDKLPECNLYVQSILPVTDKVKQSKPLLNNPRISKFNEEIKTMAEENNVKFVDLNNVLNEEEKDLHEQDGIHYKKTFYAKWLDYLKMNYFNEK